MSAVHQFIARQKHWQAIGLFGGFILLAGYGLHLLEERWHGVQFEFSDSDMPVFPMYLSWGLWLDTVAVVSKKGIRRWLTPAFLSLMATFPFVLYDLPAGFGMVAFAPAIGFIAWVVVPATKALGDLNTDRRLQFPVYLEAVMLILFPFFLWLFQPRLNRAVAKSL